jgi:hypothetical protein
MARASERSTVHPAKAEARGGRPPFPKLATRLRHQRNAGVLVVVGRYALAALKQRILGPRCPRDIYLMNDSRSKRARLSEC